MTQMVEPDRTIMIVSIVGLVVIWGSFFYHKYLQDDAPPRRSSAGQSEEGKNEARREEAAPSTPREVSGGASAKSKAGRHRPRKRGR